MVSITFESILHTFSHIVLGTILFFNPLTHSIFFFICSSKVSKLLILLSNCVNTSVLSQANCLTVVFIHFLRFSTVCASFQVLGNQFLAKVFNASSDCIIFASLFISLPVTTFLLHNSANSSII
jgi:hypothetical protein